MSDSDGRCNAVYHRLWLYTAVHNAYVIISDATQCIIPYLGDCAAPVCVPVAYSDEDLV